MQIIEKHYTYHMNRSDEDLESCENNTQNYGLKSVKLHLKKIVTLI